MYDLELTWIMPMVIIFVLMTLLLVYYAVLLDDYAIQNDQNMLLELSGGIDSDEQMTESKALSKKNYFVFEKWELNGVQKITNPMAALFGRENFELKQSFSKVKIHRMRMGLIIKYGESFFEKKR